jgi:hypothetical protein
MIDQHDVRTMASVDRNPLELISAVYLTALPLGSGPFLVQPLDALSILPLPASMRVLVADSEVVFLIAHLDPGVQRERVPTVVRRGLTSSFWLPPLRFPVVRTIWRLRDLADPAIVGDLFPQGSSPLARAA